jgi:hypothetical protein
MNKMVPKFKQETIYKLVILQKNKELLQLNSINQMDIHN